MGLEETFRTLREARTEPAEEALLAAVPEPNAQVQERAVAVLIHIESRRGVLHAIRNAHLLPPRVLSMLAIETRLVLPVLRQALRDSREQTRLNSLDLLGRIGTNEAIQEALSAMQDAAQDVRKKATAVAVGALVRFVGTRRREAASAAAGPAEASHVHTTEASALVARLLGGYEQHRERTVLEVMVEIGEATQSSIVTVLRGPDSAARRDLVRVLASSHAPATAACLFRLHRDKDPALRGAASEALADRKSKASARPLVRHVASLADDEVEMLAERIPGIPWWHEASDLARDLEEREGLKMVRFLRCSQEPPARKADALGDLLDSPHVAVRRAAVEALGHVAAPEVVNELDRALRDADEGVATRALEALLARDIPDRNRLLLPLLNSPFDSMRKRVSALVSKDSFERYIRAFDRLDEKTRALAGRAIAKIDEGLVVKLAEELGSLDGDRRFKALRIVAATELGKDLEPILLELLNDPDRRVRATLVKTIGILGSADAIRTLIHLLSDPDRRTRANAIEAFEEIGNPKIVGLLLPFLKDADNRVRANAAKACWKLGHPETIEVLAEMINDPQESMRLSAVWAFGEIAPPGVEQILADAARDDPSPTVRKKAEETLASLRREGQP